MGGEGGSLLSGNDLFLVQHCMMMMTAILMMMMMMTMMIAVVMTHWFESG